jgi:DNA-binding SARP family transcriptional activator/tetratricopeptide (TPR) repeat protein
MAVGTIVEIRILGPIAVVRNGALVPMPRSRKVRALLAYLVLSPRPVSRSKLCDVLWDLPNDPRGELRWCLSKLRGLLDDEQTRVVTNNDQVALDLGETRVDVVDIDRAARAGVETLAPSELGQLCDRFGGDVLDGLELDGNPELEAWLAAERNRFRSIHVEMLRALVSRVASGETFRRLKAWFQIAPFDMRAHEVMLEALVKAGRPRDAEEHLAGTIRAFEAEGLDWLPLREAWQHVRSASMPRVEIAAAPRSVATAPRRRASVAVMPFTTRGSGETANGLTEDVIMQLAHLRVLFVIARGSVYALAERGIGPQEAARVLGVDYVVSGSIRHTDDRITVQVELADANDGRIVWTNALETIAGETLGVIDSIVERIVSAIAEEIETEETRRAVLKPPASLDAWEAYHRGLWHMYKFTGADNADAERFFRAALALDPTFARAHAGLSFTHFQNAFLDLTPDRDRQIVLAFETAQRSVATDDQDPAAHWAIGRALWLRGEHGGSLVELERSVELSPNFALGHYTLGFVHAQRGDPKTAITACNHSRELSPFDPLQFAMLASRALAHVRLDERAEAADWAVRATARPNAHAHIMAIAAGCLSLANRTTEARRFVGRIRERLPDYSIEAFLRAFKFDADIERLFRAGARQIDFGS